MPTPPDNTTFWRSLNELADNEEFRKFLDAEFPAAAEFQHINRRRWLQLMGASIGLATAAGCWPREEVLPFAKRPEDRVPGRPQKYTTAIDLFGAAVGLVVTCVDGRPIKIEGNPKHPASLGGTDPVAQAAILQLYDPDRSRRVIQRDGGQTLVHDSWAKFDEFAAEHFARLGEAQGKGFYVLAQSSSSPTLASMRKRLEEAFPQMHWVEYEPISRDAERAALATVLGQAGRPQIDLTQARVIVTLDADLFVGHPMAVRFARDFAAGRQPSAGQMNRLYAIESGYSLSGAAADHRLPVLSSHMDRVVAAITEHVRLLADGQSSVSQPPVAEDAQAERKQDAYVRAVAADLWDHRGQCVVVAGTRQSPAVHEAVCRLNAMLGNVGKTVTYTPDVTADRPSHTEAIRSLVDRMAAGSVKTLLVLGANPAYNAPADVDFIGTVKKVETLIHLGLYHDETGRLATWHLPEAHVLESWGDVRADDGTYSVVQPMIAPIFGGRSAIELFARLLKIKDKTPLELVRDQFRELFSAEGFAARWAAALEMGLVEDSQSTDDLQPQDLESTANEATVQSESASDPSDGAVELVFTPASMLYDGRYANLGWLQECPEPMTRITWDNAALIAPATAEKLGIEDQTLVKIKVGDREVTMPAYVMPGQSPGSIAVELGYGRTAAGHVGGDVEEGVEPVGVDVYRLRTTGAMHVATDFHITPTGKRYPLAGVQDHFAIDAVGREAVEHRSGMLIREATLKYFEHHPDFAQHMDHHPPLESLWKEHAYDGHRWGMSIDLNKCIGCGACVVACQAENNVPVVGKDRVLEGREMHWIRVDRYFQGTVDEPRVARQPVACQQCELAPCEQVCPVAATVHSKEGLNDMVYNRCIGTRYCGNNCPYKVRRFNFFYYHPDLAKPENEVAKMKYNPEVTVRSRGVMEKCTYCVQRIQAVKIDAKNQDRPIADGEIRTACQQVCPAGAITFGDLSDEKSTVRQAHGDSRAYAILAELNIKPRTAYLARIRNPNPILEPEEEHAGLSHGKH